MPVRTHGQSRNYRTRKPATRTYRAWLNMLQRCTNPNNNWFAEYGGRGITVCEHWKQFENFFEDMGPCPPNLTIERKNNEKGYSKSNCIWADSTTQMLNRRKFSNNTSGFKGVWPYRNKFQTVVYFRKRRHHIGTFDTAIEAFKAKQKWLAENIARL